jgi:hypothetical protein
MSKKPPVTKRRRAIRKTPVTVSAAELAAQRVAEWYASLLYSNGALLQGHAYQISFDHVFTEVQEALTREYVAECSHMGDPDEDIVAVTNLAQEAGYLIGLQVGLRLRADGGAR